MRCFLLVLYFSTFSIISGIPISDEGNDGDSNIELGYNDQLDRSLDAVEEPTPSQFSSLLAVAPLDSDDDGDQLEKFPAKDEEQNVPQLDSETLMAENNPKTSTTEPSCDQKKELTHKILCYVAFIFFDAGIMLDILGPAVVLLIAAIIAARDRNQFSEQQRKAALQMHQAFLDANIPVNPSPQPPNNPGGTNYGKFYKSLDQDWLEKTIETAMVTMGIPLAGDALTSAATGIIPVVEGIGVLLL